MIFPLRKMPIYIYIYIYIYLASITENLFTARMSLSQIIVISEFSLCFSWAKKRLHHLPKLLLLCDINQLIFLPVSGSPGHQRGDFLYFGGGGSNCSWAAVHCRLAGNFYSAQIAVPLKSYSLITLTPHPSGRLQEASQEDTTPSLAFPAEFLT